MSGEEYVEMIEIPVNSCEVVTKPKEKKFTVKGLFSSGRFFKKEQDREKRRAGYGKLRCGKFCRR